MGKVMLGFKLHWGDAELPGYVRFQTGNFHFRDKQKANLNHHPLRLMYGLSFKTHWFLGFMSFGPIKYVSVEEPQSHD